MSARIRDHIRSNVIGYVALFFALSTGSAVALSGSNTVFTDDIVDNHVRSEDVRDDTLAGGGLDRGGPQTRFRRHLGGGGRKPRGGRPGSGLRRHVGGGGRRPRGGRSGSKLGGQLRGGGGQPRGGDWLDESLAAGDLAPGSVGSSETAADSVGSSEVAADSLAAGDLAAGSVGSSEVAADSLAAGDLAAGSVGSSEVAADSLGSGDLAAGSVGTSEVVDNSLTGSDIVEASLGSVGSANFAGDAALLDGSDSSEFLSTTLGGTVNGLLGLNTAAGADLELGEATLFRNSGTNETFTMNNPGAGDLNLFVGGQITASGYINFPTVSGSEPPSTDCDDAGEAGRAVVRTDGTTNLYICRGATGWIGK